MEVKSVEVDEKAVYLKNVAQQMGLIWSGGSLWRKGWFSCKDLVEVDLPSDGSKQAKALGYGRPRTVIEFCAHVEKAYGVTVSLEFRSDYPSTPHWYI